MFEYRRLSSNPVEIRLVEIQEASSPNDPVRLRLFHVSLYAKNVYLALSYTWGSPAAHFSDEWDDPASTLTIWIDEEPFKVRRNLESALRHLRQMALIKQIAWMHQTFWIDAICIDQNFVPERNDQIMRMRDIYSKSIGAVVWLGPATADTHLAVRKIWELFELWKARSEHLKTWPVDPEDIEEYAAVLEVEFGDDVSPQVWDAFSDFFMRSWWRRAWVLQEVFAAPDTILFAGDISVPWSAVMHTCHSLTQHTTSEVVTPDLWSPRMKAITARCQRAVASANTLHLYHQGESGDLGSLWAKRDRVLPAVALIQALRLLRPFSSSDPRDKVYAALGISLNIEAIQPDYSLDVTDVFRSTAVRILECNNDLHILDDCRFPSRLPGCPSWVPDWSDRSRARRQPLPKTGMLSGYKRQQRDQPVYSAGGKGPPLIKFWEKGRVLVLQGCVLDTLDFVGSVEQDNTYETDQNTAVPFTEEAWLAEEAKVLERNKLMIERFSDLRWLREWAVHQEATGYPYECMKRENWRYQVDGDLSQFDEIRLLPSGSTLGEAYFSTLAADLMFDAEKSSFQRVTPEILQRPASGQFIHSVLSATLPGRTFAVSRHGFIGLVPEECQAGDIIAIIQGSEVPFILRDLGGVGCFVGECFIHGMMDGEAVDLASGGFKEVPIV